MGPYFRRRLLQLVPLLFGISIVVFVVIQAAPGGPEGSLLATGRFIDPAVLEAYRHRLGVDQPVSVQYGRWLAAAVRGDLGISFSTTRPVFDMILERLPATIELMGVALLVALALAIPIGLRSALRPGGVFDLASTAAALLGLAMPVFWFGLLLQLAFAVKLGWLPVAGTHTVGLDAAGDHIAHLVLPAIVLSFRYVAAWSRYFRSSLQDVLGADFVRTARAKGLTGGAVIRVHLIRNALIPLLTIVALNVADLFAGAVITETVFAWPGIGRLFVQAMFARDYPLLMGVLLLGSVAVVGFNLIADLLYGVLDPRIRYG